MVTTCSYSVVESFRCSVVAPARYNVVTSSRCSVITPFRCSVVSCFRSSVVISFRCSVVTCFRYSVLIASGLSVDIDPRIAYTSVFQIIYNVLFTASHRHSLSNNIDRALPEKQSRFPNVNSGIASLCFADSYQWSNGRPLISTMIVSFELF